MNIGVQVITCEDVMVGEVIDEMDDEMDDEAVDAIVKWWIGGGVEVCFILWLSLNENGPGPQFPATESHLPVVHYFNLQPTHQALLLHTPCLNDRTR